MATESMSRHVWIGAVCLGLIVLLLGGCGHSSQAADATGAACSGLTGVEHAGCVAGEAASERGEAPEAEPAEEPLEPEPSPPPQLSYTSTVNLTSEAGYLTADSVPFP